MMYYSDSYVYEYFSNYQGEHKYHTNRTSILTKKTQSKAEIYYLCK